MNKIIVFIQIFAITVIGTFTGAMIMLYTAILAFWKQATSTEFLNWYANYSTGIMDSTGPLLMSSIVLPLICAFLVWRNRQSRMYWLISFILTGMIMLITLNYFVDVNTSFGNKSIELNSIKETLNTWGNFHLVRIFLAFISTLIGAFGLVKYISSKRQIN